MDSKARIVQVSAIPETLNPKPSVHKASKLSLG